MTQHLELGHECPHTYPQIDFNIYAEQVACILATYKQRSSLALNTWMDQAMFDELLTRGTQLTSFTCAGLNLHQYRSASPCSWRELVIENQTFIAETLACIPTASLAPLAFGCDVVFPLVSPNVMMTCQMPELVRRGLTNLMRCPAWQQCGPGVSVSLNHLEHRPEVQTLLLGALAPLVSKDVSLSIYMPAAVTGGLAVQQLGGALGTSLKQLVLQRCALSEDFWPAVWAHLPGLQQLTVEDNVYGFIGMDELASFCGGATHPLQLNLGQRLYKKVGAEGKLDQEGRWRGVPQVTVTEAVKS